MENGKHIVLVVSVVMNTIYYFYSIRHYRVSQVDLELLRMYSGNQWANEYDALRMHY